MKARSNEPRNPEDLPPEAASQLPSDPPTLKETGTVIGFKQILVPIDFSDCSLRALDYAIALAVSFGAKLTLLHVVEPTPHPQSYLGVTPPLDETNQTLVEAGRERLAAVGKKRIGQRLRTETLVRMGRAHSEIPDTASALGADLIVVGTHGYTGLKHVLLGSTAERIVRHAHCPVLTVRLT